MHWQNNNGIYPLYRNRTDMLGIEQTAPANNSLRLNICQKEKHIIFFIDNSL